MAIGVAELTCYVSAAQNLNDHLSDPSAINAFNYATKFTCVADAITLLACMLVLQFPVLLAPCLRKMRFPRFLLVLQHSATGSQCPCLTRVCFSVQPLQLDVTKTREEGGGDLL
jgi:hypothetical protein